MPLPAQLTCSACALACLALVAAPRAGNDAPAPFVEMAEQVGLRFAHVNGATGEYYMPEIMGAGVALFDYDSDGDLDVFLLQGGPLTGQGQALTSRLFRNDLEVAPDGTRVLRFTDVTEQAGLVWRGYGMGAAVGDYNNDGHPDLYITAFGDDALYRNNGDGTFTDVTAESGIRSPLWSTSAAFVDYDRDGHLDLFLTNYLDFAIADNKVCRESLGARDYCSPRSYRPVQDRLFRNLGNGRFADVTESAGIARTTGAGLGVSIGDYNGDGWLDIYVANDATPNQLWINRGDGTFVDEGLFSGAAFNAAGNPEGSMGIASGDVNANGHEDLFITNLVGETFVLYENDGHGSFEDVRARWGLAQPTAPYTGFGTDWFDYDNDGWLDLFVANGAVNIIEAQRGAPMPFRMLNQLFRHTGAGRFVEKTADAGPAFAWKEVSRGAAFGDIDNDGDIDIVVTNNAGPVRLLINQAAAGHHWLLVRLDQESGNRFGMGAWIGLERAGRPTLWRRAKTDGSYLSASDLRVHFGLGASPEVDALRVRWPDAVEERWTGIEVDRVVTLRRGTGEK
jgi:enediyne biosynthesis protein E4